MEGNGAEWTVEADKVPVSRKSLQHSKFRRQFHYARTDGDRRTFGKRHRGAQTCHEVYDILEVLQDLSTPTVLQYSGQ